MSNYFTLSSSDKTTGTNSNFVVKLSNPIENIKGIKISKIMVPFSWYTIMSGINDKIYFTETSDWTATLTEGVYTFQELCTEIETQMNSAYTTDNNFSCSFSTLTYKYTISHTSTAFSFTFGTNTTASAAKTMGFNNTDTTSATSHTSDKLVNLSYSDTIFIKSSVLGGSSSNIGGKKKSYIFPMQINGNFGDFFTYESQGDDWTILYTPEKHFDYFDFSLIFDDGDTEVPLNGLDWRITFKYIKGNKY